MTVYRTLENMQGNNMPKNNLPQPDTNTLLAQLVSSVNAENRKNRPEPYSQYEHNTAESIVRENKIPFDLYERYHALSSGPESFTRLTKLAVEYKNAFKTISDRDLNLSDRRAEKIRELTRDKENRDLGIM